jgi:hypothetical protein
MVHKLREQDEPSVHPLEDHPKYVRAIGMVALETNALELRLADLLARMLFLPLRIGQAIYLSPKAEQTRIDILRNAAHARLAVSESKRNTTLGKQKTRALKDVMAIAKRAEALIRERHRIIHDEWNFSDIEKKVTRKLLDGRPGRERVPTRKREIDTLIQKLRVLIDETYELALSFKEHPPFMANLKSDSRNSG